MNVSSLEKIVLGGGCFWCIEAIYERIPGVISAVSGYAGGQTKNPTYEAVCSGLTGHAEVVEIAYDPKQISLPKILEIFFKAHDPTTKNRQGNDVGNQYRSIILFQNKQDEALIKSSIAEASSHFANPIITEVKNLETFYPAEDYHQNYFAKNPNQGYCQAVIAPKLKKLYFLFQN